MDRSITGSTRLPPAIYIKEHLPGASHSIFKGAQCTAAAKWPNLEDTLRRHLQCGHGVGGEGSRFTPAPGE